MNNWLSSKSFFWTILNLVLVVAFFSGIRAFIFSPFYENERIITVEAEGKTIVTPDIANISFSVISEGVDPKTIQEENSKKMKNAIDFVKSQGVADKDIKTANYNLYPKYDYSRPPVIFYPDGNRQEIIGYTLSQTVFIKVRDLEKTGEILGGLPEKGINQIEQISFEVEDSDKYLNQAREEAFKKAEMKARAMAKANGVRIKRVVNFSDYGGGYPYPVPYFAESFGKGGADATIQSPPIEPGSQEVLVRVSVSYEIR